MPDPSDYGWVEDVLSEAACVTAVAGATLPDVLAGFGADTSVTLSADDAYGGDEENFASVAAREVLGGVIAVELNGFQGALEETLARLSLLGRTASIFWNVNDDNALSCEVEGEVVAAVDMYDAEDPDAVDLPTDLMALFPAAGGEDADMWAVGLAMVATFTGVAISEETVRGAAPFHPIP